MPYISQAERADVIVPHTPGQLNYEISLACWDYLNKRGLDYTSLNEVIGVLECAKLEFYRRIAAPYEDHKCEVNGDIYE